jgi:hypothetical protein
MKFIIWDPRDNYRPRTDEEGNEIVSDGLLGRVGEDNVYLTTYAEYPRGRRHTDLAVGECVKGVHFRLSGEHGVYDVYRVD